MPFREEKKKSKEKPEHLYSSIYGVIFKGILPVKVHPAHEGTSRHERYCKEAEAEGASAAVSLRGNSAHHQESATR